MKSCSFCGSVNQHNSVDCHVACYYCGGEHHSHECRPRIAIRSHKVNICEIFNPLLKQHGGTYNLGWLGSDKNRIRRLMYQPATYSRFKALRLKTAGCDGDYHQYHWLDTLPPLNETESKFYKRTTIIHRTLSQPKLSSEDENEVRFSSSFEGTWLVYLPREILDYILKLKHQMFLNKLNKEFLDITTQDLRSEKHIRYAEMKGYRFIKQGGRELQQLHRLGTPPPPPHCNYAIIVQHRSEQHNNSRDKAPIYNIYNCGMFKYSIGSFQHFRNKPVFFNDVLSQRHGITQHDYDLYNDQFGLGSVSSWGHPSSSRWCCAEKFREHFKHLGIKGFSQLKKADLVRLYFTEDVRRKKIGDM